MSDAPDHHFYVCQEIELNTDYMYSITYNAHTEQYSMTSRDRFPIERQLTDSDNIVFDCPDRKTRLGLPLPDGNTVKHLNMEDARWFINRDFDFVLNELEWDETLFQTLPKWVQAHAGPELKERHNRRIEDTEVELHIQNDDDADGNGSDGMDDSASETDVQATGVSNGVPTTAPVVQRPQRMFSPEPQMTSAQVPAPKQVIDLDPTDDDEPSHDDRWWKDSSPKNLAQMISRDHTLQWTLPSNILMEVRAYQRSIASLRSSGMTPPSTPQASAKPVAPPKKKRVRAPATQRQPPAKKRRLDAASREYHAVTGTLQPQPRSDKETIAYLTAELAHNTSAREELYDRTLAQSDDISKLQAKMNSMLGNGLQSAHPAAPRADAMDEDERGNCSSLCLPCLFSLTK